MTASKDTLKPATNEKLVTGTKAVTTYRSLLPQHTKIFKEKKQLKIYRRKHQNHQQHINRKI